MKANRISCLTLACIYLFLITISCKKKESANEYSGNVLAVSVAEDSLTEISYPDYRMLDTIPKPAWLKAERLPKCHDEIDYSEIAFDKVRFKGFSPLIFDNNEKFECQLENKNIEIAEILTHCCGEVVKKKIKYLKSEGSIYFKVDSMVYLESIDFRYENASMYIDSIALNSSTTRDFVAKKFPDSFKWRNFGINSIASLLEPEQGETFSFLIIRDSNSQNLLKLNFVNNKLFYCDFIYECI